MIKKCLALIITSALFLALLILILVPEKPLCPYQNEASQVVKAIPIPSEKNKYETLLKEISKLEGHQETYFYEVYKAVTFFHEINGFHRKNYLEKQRALIHSAVAATRLYDQIQDHDASLQFPSDRALSLKKFGFFKERPSPYYEVICWELALLLGCEEYIAPTCLGVCQEKERVYQSYIEGRINPRLFQSNEKFSRRILEIELDTFCKANAFFILLGHQDLIPFNIPVTKSRIPILWDNESVFPVSNQVAVWKKRGHLEFKVPFVNILIDYPQAYSPIKDKKVLLSTLEAWNKEDLIQYLNHPLNCERLTKKQREALLERFDYLTDRDALTDSSTFREYIEKIFPDLFIGAKDVRELVAKLVDYPVTDMSALYFIDRYRDWWDPLTEEDHKTLNNWIEKNHILR